MSVIKDFRKAQAPTGSGDVVVTERRAIDMLTEIQKRLYSERTMGGDEMRDIANKINNFLAHGLIEYRETWPS